MSVVNEIKALYELLGQKIQVLEKNEKSSLVSGRASRKGNRSKLLAKRRLQIIKKAGG